MILEVKDLKKYYGRGGNLTRALDGVSFAANKGEFLTIMGASGSGKTTLLNLISTIDRPTSGEITVAGTTITKLKGGKLNDFRRDNLGFVFQDFNLLDNLTARENIALALAIQKISPRQIAQKVETVAQALEISHILDKFPHEISGGQKQRVATARALVVNPKLILADEPTGALDSKSAKTLLEKFSEMNQKLSTTILMVSHDAVAASYSSRVIFIRDGCIFREIYRGKDSRKTFFEKIIKNVTILGEEK